MDTFQVSALLTFFIWGSTDCSFLFSWTNSPMFIFLRTSCSESYFFLFSFSVFFAISSFLLINCYNSSRLYPKQFFFPTLYPLTISFAQQFLFLFLDDSQMSISSPDFFHLYVRISNYLCSSTRVSPRHLKFIMFKTIPMYSLFIPQTWSSSTTPYFNKLLPFLNFFPLPSSPYYIW